jgi:hypothetical protein
MEIAYLHLVTNHIPIIAVPFTLLLILWGLWRKSDEVVTAGLLLFALLGAATLAVYLLGQGGEDFIEDLPGVSHDAIEAHEGFALFGLISVLLVSAASIFALLRYRLRGPKSAGDTPAQISAIYPRWVVLAVVVLALGSAAVLGYTGRLGGKIRHTEFHAGDTAIENERDQENGSEEKEGRGRNRGRR